MTDRIFLLLADLDRMLAIQPDSDSMWLMRGMVLEQSGRSDEALDSYDRAIEIEPNYDLALEQREALESKVDNTKAELDGNSNNLVKNLLIIVGFIMTLKIYQKVRQPRS
jgi:tetratricopeptide (TPR) repeat protein